MQLVSFQSLKTLLLLSICFATCNAQPTEFTVDSTHSSLIFGVSHANISYIYGRFNTVSGAYTLDSTTPGNCQFKFSAPINSIDTNDPKRDEHLRGPDFFSEQEFPTIEFASSSVQVDGDLYTVKGKLTLHGVTRDVELQLQKVGEGPGPGGGDFRTGFIVQYSLKRSDYEMKNMIGPVGDDVTVTFCFEGVKQKTE